MSDSARHGWEVWIDVGGTFTDCVARRPDGRLETHKLLSSGAYKLRAAPGADARRIVAATLPAPAAFFRGWRLRLAGQAAEARIVHVDPRGGLGLDPPLPADPPPEALLELTAGLEAPVVGVRRLLGRPLDQAIGPVRVKLGTTRGTNALLERSGARTALVTTAGLADVLRIGYQTRPKLFDLRVRKPQDLYAETLEVAERIDARGNVLRPLALDGLPARLRALRERGIDSLAIVLLNSHRNAAHEAQLARLAHEAGFAFVSVSHRLSPLERIVPRGETTVVDAYLAPIIAAYLARLRAQMPEARLELMTSAGALVDADRFLARDSVLSGPAAGVVGAAAVGRLAGRPRVIGLDMGGTSTDVSRYDGRYVRRYEMALEDRATGGAIRIMAPMLEIETVAAGGGSICDFDGVKPTVGPRSAGADPGPACYGAGGPLCLTDVNLHLGRILPERFAIPLDAGAVRERLGALIDRIEQATGRRYEPDELAAGYLEIANAHMAAAIRKVSSQRGIDPRDYALVAFGGAGGQHACALARELGIAAVLLHPLAGLLSAYGIGMADVRAFAARDLGALLPQATGPAGSRSAAPPGGAGDRPALSDAALRAHFESLEQAARAELLAQGVPAESLEPAHRALELRYVGQDATLLVAQPSDGDWRAAFDRQHQREFGFAFPGRGVEACAARVEVVGRAYRPPPVSARSAGPPADPQAYVHAWFASERRRTPVFAREALQPGQAIDGPAIVTEATGAIVIEPQWRATLGDGDTLVLEQVASLQRAVDRPRTVRRAAGASRSGPQPDADPIALELFNNQFAAIADQMGAALQRSALSTNVKERLDFSCAICDADGRLVAHAPHIPVHLGAIGTCVRRVLDALRNDPDAEPLAPGDVIITNDPGLGGSHLPDVTVITPVFADSPGGRASAPAGGLESPQAAGAGSAARPVFFTANRAHHAEIGGIAPGSMPPDSRSLAQEGVLVRCFRAVRDGKLREDELLALLRSGPYPSRAPEQNLADIRAQIAANQTGARRLAEMVARHGLDVVRAYMRHIQAAAATKMRAALRRIAPGTYTFADALDDGAPLAVRIDIADGRARIDFAGTGPVLPGNLNATPAIVASAVLYAFRCLIAEDIPLNDGLLEPLEIVLPESLLNPPRHADPARCAAVAGGNVETSQRVVDVLLGALGLAAASQGTMNNLTFGDERFGYYETIGGGAGAGPGWHGASAVHTHMTNTRLTDPEVLEHRYPVRLRRFAIRRGSGGDGQWRGGDGVIREIEFLAPVQVSLLTQRRTRPPYGLAGGRPGKPGTNRLIRANRAEVVLPWNGGFAAAAGDRLVIETPGGGGYGRPGAG